MSARKQYAELVAKIAAELPDDQRRLVYLLDQVVGDRLLDAIEGSRNP